MGYQLRREVRAAIPAGLLTAAERLLVLELADICGDDTREGWPGAAKLAEMTDLSERSIQEAPNRIGKKWIELRVPLGKSESGKVFYSYAGRRTTFRFPPLPPREGATDPGSCGATDPGASAEKGATDPGGRCDRSVEKVRQIRGPFPYRTSQNFNTSPPPTPSGPLEVVEAEILEEEGDETSSLELQIQKLIDEIGTTRPAWSATELRTHVLGAMNMLGDSFEAAAEVARRTAKDPGSARPSRITASGNPHLRAASTAYLVAQVSDDALGTQASEHPDAHRFEPKPDSPRDCQHCPFPEPNGRHRINEPPAAVRGQQRYAAVDNRRRYEPWRPPVDQSEYDQPFSWQLDSA